MSACDPPDRRTIPFPTPHGGCSTLADESESYANHASDCLQYAHESLADGAIDEAGGYVAHARYHANGAIEAHRLVEYYATCIEHEAETGLCAPLELAAMARERLQAERAAERARVVKAELPALDEQIERVRGAQVSVCHA